MTKNSLKQKLQLTIKDYNQTPNPKSRAPGAAFAVIAVLGDYLQEQGLASINDLVEEVRGQVAARSIDMIESSDEDFRVMVKSALVAMCKMGVCDKKFDDHYEFVSGKMLARFKAAAGELVR